MTSYEEKQLLERIDQLKRVVSDQEKILKAVMQLNFDFVLDKVLVNILQQMSNAISAEAGSLWLVDQKTQQISARAAIGPNADQVKNIKLSWGEGIVGSVILSKKGELVPDVTRDLRWARRVDKESGFVTRSILTLPLVSKSSAIGAIQLINKMGTSHFDERDYQLAVTLAVHSAIAIRNSQMYEQLNQNSQRLVQTLLLAMESREPEIQGHSRRVSQFSVWTAEILGLPADQIRELERAALLHDMGRLGVSESLWGKNGDLGEEEYKGTKTETFQIELTLEEWPEAVRQTCLYLHEKVDGTGYPEGLKGEEIPLFARIVSIAEAYDNLTQGRDCHQVMSSLDAVKELIKCAGTSYDRQVIDAFVRALNEKGELRKS